ncbi:hypothetical protein DFH27DRAFT_87478 [Peziza echinospora]|nr:hypothetical protein DFH27DRAFT_87478 [Peziza echinospora]
MATTEGTGSRRATPESETAEQPASTPKESEATTLPKPLAGKQHASPVSETEGAGPAKRAKLSHTSEPTGDTKNTWEGSSSAGGGENGSGSDRESGEEGEYSEDDEGGEGEADDDLEEGEEREGDNQDPPLPPGPPPGQADGNDDGWQAIWDDLHQAYYFYNAITGQSTWTNPRVPEATVAPVAPVTGIAVDSGVAPGVVPTEGLYATSTLEPPPEGATGDVVPYTGEPGSEEAGYEPTYYQLAHGITDPTALTAEDIANTYASTGTFNRFTGKWQANKGPEQHNDENKTRRQMEFYFDVDAAANSHDGRSLKAERQMKKLSKKELKAFREKRKEKKEQKRRAWLKD